MPRYKLTIEYVGNAFSGWQIQPDAVTVEGILEDAFSTVLQTSVDLVGQGRTDAGVHAAGQTAHVDIAADVDIGNLIHRVNLMAGKDVQIHQCELVPDDFHARFDATSRLYEYHLMLTYHPLKQTDHWWPGKGVPADMKVLNRCAEWLTGEHDFSGFSKFNPDNYTTLCTIYESEWLQTAEGIKYRIRGNRFLRNMVRRLVGTMLEVSAGKFRSEQFKGMLEDSDRSERTVTAPAHGLSLKQVFYEKNEN